MKGTVAEPHAALRLAYGQFGVMCASGKETERCFQAKRKGLFVDGTAGRASLGIDRLLSHVAMTAWIIGQPTCKLKWLQSVVGRWVSDFA
eukprot:15719896-Heterocapsa_arctica.AAC.1